jgi:hypothetical protein
MLKGDTMERADWLKIQAKYKQHKTDETFAADSETENDTMVLLAEICEELWKLRHDQP